MFGADEIIDEMFKAMDFITEGEGVMFAAESSSTDTDGADLLISILLRYPEVATVKFSPDCQSLTITFILADAEQTCDKQLLKALEVYHSFERNKMKICRLDKDFESPYHIIHLTRDIQTLSQSELNLIVELIKDQSGELVFDQLYLPEDEIRMQEEIISRMLVLLNKHKNLKTVTAVKEEGRLLVYSR